MIRYTFILILTLLVLSCKNNQQHTSEETVDTLAKNEIGEPTSSDPNESGSYIIFRKEKDINTNLPQIEYVILKNSPPSVIKKGFISMGSIEWIGPTSLRIVDLPRIMPEGKTMEDYVSIINLNQP